MGVESPCSRDWQLGDVDEDEDERAGSAGRDLAERADIRMEAASGVRTRTLAVLLLLRMRRAELNIDDAGARRCGRR